MQIVPLSTVHIGEIALSLKAIMMVNSKPGHQITISLDNHFRLLYLVSGEVKFLFFDNTIPTCSGDVLYIPTNTTYTSHWSKTEMSSILMIDIALADGNGNPIDFGDTARILFHDECHIYNEIRNDVEHLSWDIPFGWMERMSVALKILGYFARDSGNGSLGEKYWKIRKGVRYIEENYTSDFLISEAAKLCGMSPGYFRRLFVDLKGMSPVGYRNKLRIQKSIELLKSGQYNVTEAGQAVGIDDVKYFSKLFRQTTGALPSKIMER